MKPIEENERRVVNIRDEAAFSPADPSQTSEVGTSMIQLNRSAGHFVGFYIYRMAPGSNSAPHKHGGAEEFFVIEGELIDNDGTVYRQGDVVWLAAGTEHTSHSPGGALVAVYSERQEQPVTIEG